LPSGLITDLEQAILNGSLDQEPVLADALKESADNFEYETILTLIK